MADLILDGAKLAVLSNRIEGIASKMGNTLLKTGRSGVINRGKDFSCCVVSADCELLAAAESLPAHVLGAELIAKSLHELQPRLCKGDAFLHNSPYHGNAHAADHTILVPVMDEQGAHHFTVLAKAHLADIGNSVPTTYHAAARDVYQEGALIFPATRIQQNYEDIKDIIRLCEMRIRVPDQWYGDYLAMIAAARIGERELLALAQEVGWETLHAFTDQWLSYSELRMEQAIRRMPAGETQATSIHDPFPGLPDGVPVKSKVRIDPAAGEIHVDLSDNMDCQPCGMNLTRATAMTAALIGVFNSIDHTIPKNTGSCRRVKITLRDNCIVGIPVHPVSCSVATSNLADRVTNATQAAISQIADGFGMAESGCILPPGLAVVSGVDPRNGKKFVNQILLATSGGAGNPFNDGGLTLLCPANAGMSYHDSIELDELYHPMVVYQRRFVPDTEGAGQHRGAFALRCDYGPVGADMEIGYASDGNINAAKGTRGGHTASGAYAGLIRRDGSVETLPAVAQHVLRDGERVISISCGGGGYGDPMHRDVAAVLQDVADGMVSETRAREIYGVEVHADGTADLEATRRRRNAVPEVLDESRGAHSRLGPRA